MAGKRKRRRRREFQREIANAPAQQSAAGGLAMRAGSSMVHGALQRLKHAPEPRPGQRPGMSRANATGPKLVHSGEPVPPATSTQAQSGKLVPTPDAPATPAAAEGAPIVRVWRNVNYTLLTAGSLPSFITQWMQRVGIGWLTWELTHSTVWLGLIAAADLAPMIVLAPFAGAACDRFSMMTMMRISYVLVFLQAVALAVITGAGLVTIEALLLLSLFTGVVHPFLSAARHTIVPSLVPRSDFATAVALDSALFQASRFVGPAIAALMIPFAGVNSTFIAHVVGMIIMVATLFVMNVPQAPQSRHRRHNMLIDVVESFIYVRRHAGIGPIFVLLTVASILIRPLQDMLPGFAGGVFHADATGLAWLTSAMGVGAMLSAGWIAFRGRVQGLTTVLLLGGLGIVVATLGFVATPTLWIGVLFSAISGFALNVMSTSVQSLVQTAVADDMRGRVMSLYILIFRGTPAIGTVLLGLFAEWYGLQLAFAIAAGLAFLAWLVVAPRRRTIAAALEKA